MLPDDHSAGLRQLALFTSGSHPCSYLPEREAVTQFVDPTQTMTMALYSSLIDQGFRRSGRYIYRPRCSACEACTPARIPVRTFLPNRAQRRTWARNTDLSVQAVPAAFHEEHFLLYQRYMQSRHGDGDMNPDDREQYREFLISPWSDTLFLEFRLDTRLVAVAVVDRLRQGLSAVYTFFDPELAPRSLGSQAILWQLHLARACKLGWVYLGYWVPGCAKMSYKAHYRPLEIFRDNVWSRLSDTRDTR